MEVSNDYLPLQQLKLNLFKEQDPETGRFNVIFEIEGKLLYAHQNMLNLVSSTFDAMLSDRWMKNKDEPIKIKDYCYADFYEFLLFLYSGQCRFTDSNIYSMVDMAEFYGIELFKDYCINYLSRMEITMDNIFQLMDLAEKYSITRLQTRVNDFIPSNFAAIIASDGFLNVTKNVAKEIVVAHKYIPEPEDIFVAVFKWSENQATNKQAADNPTLNVNDVIKTEISDFLPHIFFRGMDLKFLNEFVVPRGFIFSSLTELGKILSDHRRFFEGKVKVTNENGQTLHGKLTDKIVLRNIESLKLLTSYFFSDNFCLWPTNFSRPSAPSSLKKRDDIEWYLFYWSEGRIGIERCSVFGENDYLLAELTPGPTGFETTERCKIEIE